MSFIIYPIVEYFNHVLGILHVNGANFKVVENDSSKMIIFESDKELEIKEYCSKILVIKNDYVYDKELNLGRFTKERGHKSLFTYKNQSYDVIDIPFCWKSLTL